jgi:hypothetical protein
MPVPVIEYVALALSTGSGLGYSFTALPSVEVAPSNLGDTVSGPSCWASSRGVSADYGTLQVL